MTSILKATTEHALLLSQIGKQSFIESHAHSASEKDVKEYIDKAYSIQSMNNELSDPKNIYYIIYHIDKAAGFSKIVLNSSYKDLPAKNITKLERIYLLKEFYSLKLGNELMEFNIRLSKNNEQLGMWLLTWKENERAIAFYKKFAFTIIGSGDFRLTETHSNPNHIMYLEY